MAGKIGARRDFLGSWTASLDGLLRQSGLSLGVPTRCQLPVKCARVAATHSAICSAVAKRAVMPQSLQLTEPAAERMVEWN